MRQITRRWPWPTPLRPPHVDLTRFLSRGLPESATVSLRVRWPLYLIGLAAVAQILMPDPVWTTTAISLIILYLAGWLWVRSLARGLSLTRLRQGTLLVAGDSLDEGFVLTNSTNAPAPWVEFIDDSDLPGYTASRVVGAGARSTQRWRMTALCQQRGVYRLGPHRLLAGDPLHFFDLTMQSPQSEAVLIYPRVVELPPFPLPRGYSQGDVRTRRPLQGTLPAMSVRGYQPDDDLRYIHWPTTARLGHLMVRELEQEPTGDVWIVLDASAGARLTHGDHDTLETAVIAAASLGAQFLEARTRRSVGLLAASGDPERLVVEPPQTGRAHIWRLLAALAPIRHAATPLAELLRQARDLTGSRSSIVIVTSQLADAGALEKWTAQMVRLNERGLTTAALLVTTPQTEPAANEVIALLARYRIPVRLLPFDAPLRALLTHRRRRKVIRSTPSGGVVAVEVEEEVS